MAGLTSLLLLAPAIQQLTGWPADPPPADPERMPLQPGFTTREWLAGRFARRYERWDRTRMGFRGFLTRLARQTDFTLFGRVDGAGRVDLIRGKDDWLFDATDVRQAVRQFAPPVNSTRLWARHAATLDQSLASRGTAFLIVLAPSKAETIADRLPDSVRPPPPREQTARHRLARVLEKAEAPFLDATLLFSSTDRSDEPPFTRTGSCWTTPAAWEAWQAVAEALDHRHAGLRFSGSATTGHIRIKAARADRDWRPLLNLWRYGPNDVERLDYPVVATPQPDREGLYQALILGDGQSLAMADALARSGLFRQIDLLLDGHRRLTYPSPAFTATAERPTADAGILVGPIRFEEFDWAPLLENRQLVLLVLGGSSLPRLDRGALASLSRFLDNAPATDAHPLRRPAIDSE